MPSDRDPWNNAFPIKWNREQFHLIGARAIATICPRSLQPRAGVCHAEHGEADMLETREGGRHCGRVRFRAIPGEIAEEKLDLADRAYVLVVNADS
jgi:hypothetical protein